MPSRFAIISRSLFALLLLPMFVMAQSQVVRQIPRTRSAPLPATPPPSDSASVGPELDSAVIGNDADGGGSDGGTGIGLNRSIAKGPGAPISHGGERKAKSNPELALTIDGINHFQQRFVAGGGNQFSIEPPDQGLCAGNGFVMETVNDTVRIFDATGNPVTAPTSLNDFYHYAPAIDRVHLLFGPNITDPSCLFDTQTQRWFHVVLTLDRVRPSGSALAGTNHLDVAVSATADPTGAWNFYSVPVQDDGTQGTPDHGCVARTKTGLVHGPCLGDYPHIGADASGFYITTNEFSLFGPGFFGAQIYALSKLQLASGAASVNVAQFNTGDPSLGLLLDGIAPGFTVWPATSTGNEFELGQGGTEYFLSSDAVFTDTGTANWVRLWTLTNTSSLSTLPALGANFSVVPTMDYSVPAGNAVQKAGEIPFADCLADTTLQVTATLFGCWRLAGTTVPGPFVNTEKTVNVNDSRMQQVAFANGKLWGALDTWLSIPTDTASRAGVAFFVINPNSKKVEQQGNVGILGNNLSYPAIAVTASGRGVMAFTVLGNDHYPSAGYAGIDTKIGVGDIHIAAEGVGPDDGFTGYHPNDNNNFGPRPRWGDYGAAASDGNAIWIGSEYINQTCTFAQFVNSNFRCGSTRTLFGNWSTRISKVVP